MTAHPERAPQRARAGFTLVELMVAVVLVTIIGGTIGSVLLRQQQFYRSAAELIETRSQIRQGLSVLPTDLRSVSIAAGAAGDINAMSASEIDFWATIGTGVVCQAGAVNGSGHQTVNLIPLGAAAGSYTSWVLTPRVDDQVALYNDATGRFSARLALVPTGSPAAVVNSDLTACPPGTGAGQSPFLTTDDGARSRPRMIINLATNGTPAVAAATAGVPVRIVRRVRYSLYQRTEDSQWYLGYTDDPANKPAEVQPVSGPYRPLAADTTSGLTFTYYNSAGAVLPFTARDQVARIEVVVRGLTRNAGNIAGMKRRADGRYADFDRFSIVLRNRW